jgi:hypothetical protein
METSQSERRPQDTSSDIRNRRDISVGHTFMALVGSLYTSKCTALILPYVIHNLPDMKIYIFSLTVDDSIISIRKPAHNGI